MKSVGAGFWARIALLFLVRSGRATATLSIMVITAVAALIFLSALAVGVKDAMLRNTVGLFSGHISGYNITDAMETQDLMIDGVDTVLKRSYLRGVLSANSLSQHSLVCGIEPLMEARRTALKRRIVEGRYPFSGRREVLISHNISRNLGVHTGDRLRFKFRGETGFLDLSVSGIFNTGLDALDREMAFIPLDLGPFKMIPWSAAVFLEMGVDPDPVLRICRLKFPEPARFESWATRMPDLKQLIDLEAISMAIVTLLVFGVVAIGIACSFVIFINRNMREYDGSDGCGDVDAHRSQGGADEYPRLRHGPFDRSVCRSDGFPYGGDRYQRVYIPQSIFRRIRGYPAPVDGFLPVDAACRIAAFQLDSGFLAGSPGCPAKSGRYPENGLSS